MVSTAAAAVGDSDHLMVSPFGPGARSVQGFAAASGLDCLRGPTVLADNPKEAGTSYWVSVVLSFSWTLARKIRIFLGFFVCFA